MTPEEKLNWAAFRFRVAMFDEGVAKRHCTDPVVVAEMRTASLDCAVALLLAMREWGNTATSSGHEP